MREVKVEDALVAKVEAAGGDAPKLVVPSKRGYPDRLIILPGRPMWMAETKSPTWGALSKLQQKRIRELRPMGVRVELVGSLQTVEDLIL